MENSKFLKLLIPIFILGFFVAYNAVFAYDTETHAYLTSEVIKFYNKNFPNNKISDDLVPYLLDGSRREDNVPRWMNHFYDPIYERGLTDSVLGAWQKSKDWAQDSNNQNSLTYKIPATIASILTAIQQIKINTLTTETDFTWQRAIRFYVQGEKEKAMFILGHILHLIEDKAVPDHTRNDPHPGDSPYENWTNKFTLNNPDKNLTKRLENKRAIILNNLSLYFDELAKYSNNNFYSKDRIGIQDGYKLPEPDYFKIGDDNKNYGMKIDKEFGDYFLIKSPPKLLSISLDKEEFLKSDLILADYWSRLSTKAVQYGAGAINLFFQEVEKAKNDPNFAKTEEKSIFAKAFEATKNLFAQVSDLFSGSGGFQSVGEISLNQSQNPSTLESQTPNIKSQNIKQCSFNTSQSPLRQKIIINEVAWMGNINSSDDEWIELKNISNAAINLSGYQLIDQAEQIKIIFGENDKIPANGFYLLERTDDDSVPNIKADKIYTGRLSNTNEGLRLFDGQCNLIDEVFASPNWPAGDSATKKTMERNSTNLSWYTSSIIGGTPKRENSRPAVATASGGGTPTNNQQQTTNGQQPVKILINEIQISPTGNRFIELYNPNNSSVDLTGWYLQRKTQTGSSFGSLVSKTYFEGKTISANNYFLISRDIMENADIILNGLTLTGSNTIQLKNSNGEVIDKVGWGQASDCENNCAPEPSDNQSIQRKFQNNIFIDTDNNASDFEIQTCPSPKTQTCQQSNQALSAFFVYAPLNPKVGDLITFNAASSTGQIVLYQWDFGSGQTTTTQKSITYSYSTPGNYTVRLTVFDNQNASLAATSTIFVDTASSNVNHLLISEIQVRGDAADDEFIELYNPTNNAISLSGYSIQYLSGTTTSTEKISNTKKNFANNAWVAPKSFYLLVNNNATSSLLSRADMTYSFSLSGNPSGATIFLVSTTTPISGTNEPTIVDSLSYGNPKLAVSTTISTVPDSNKSLERKAFYSGACISAQNEGEFLGNGCDTDSATDFEIRNTPNPQNSLSFPEPRSAPTAPGNFTVQYSSSTTELIFNWEASQDYSGATSSLIYKITDISNANSTIITTTTSTTFTTTINEFERDYAFSIQCFDKEGLGSATGTTSITLPKQNPIRVIYSQPDDTTEFFIRTGSQRIENLGKNLSGRATQVCIKIKVDINTGGDSGFYMWQQTTDDASNELGRVYIFVNNYWQLYNTEPLIICQNFDFVLDPDKFTFILLRPTNYPNYQSIYIYGSSAGKIFYQLSGQSP